MTPDIDRNPEPVQKASAQARGAQQDGEEAFLREEDRLGEEARKLAGTGKRLAATWAENQKSAVSGRLKETASGLRRFGDSLESEPNLKDYLEAAADSLDDVSDQIRNQPVGELMDSAQDYARERPITVFGTAFLAGLILSRVLRAGYMEAGSSIHNGRGRHG